MLIPKIDKLIVQLEVSKGIATHQIYLADQLRRELEAFRYEAKELGK